MSQNRPDLIKRFIGVASNIIAHKILIKAELEEDLRNYYNKEIERDIDSVLKYRNRINPVNRLLPQKGFQGNQKQHTVKSQSRIAKKNQ